MHVLVNMETLYLSRMVKLYDIRHPKNCLVNLKLDREQGKKMMQWCRFSPCSGSRLLTSSLKNIEIYNAEGLKHGKVKYRPDCMIPHNNRFAPRFSFFRPMWIPQREDCFLVGSVNFDPREVSATCSS